MGHYDANVPIKPATPGRFVLVRVSAEMNPSKLETAINGPIIPLTIIFASFRGTYISYLFPFMFVSLLPIFIIIYTGPISHAPLLEQCDTILH